MTNFNFKASKSSKKGIDHADLIGGEWLYSEDSDTFLIIIGDGTERQIYDLTDDNVIADDYGDSFGERFESYNETLGPFVKVKKLNIKYKV